jgi:Family of unknown function (DUF6496)
MATAKSKTSHTATRKAATRSASSESTSKKTGTRKYSPEASKHVEEEMKEMKEGKLKSGGSGKTVRNPKQAIAIGLSEARKAGAKVPPAKPRRKAA